MRYFALALFAGLAVAACSGCATSKGVAGIATKGLDDKLESQVQVNTQKYHADDLVFGLHDVFFRGFIDKSNCSVTYQIYAVIVSGDWRYWDQARISFGDDLKELPAQRVASNVFSNQYGTKCFEEMVVQMDRGDIERLAQDANIVRFASSKVDERYDFEIDPLEAKEFLVKMDEAIASLPVK